MLERLGSSHSSVLIFFSLLTCSANSCLNPLLWNPLPATPTAIDMRAFLLFAKHFRKSTFLPGPLHYCSLCPSDSSIAQCFTTFRRLLQYWLFWSILAMAWPRRTPHTFTCFPPSYIHNKTFSTILRTTYALPCESLLCCMVTQTTQKNQVQNLSQDFKGSI